MILYIYFIIDISDIERDIPPPSLPTSQQPPTSVSNSDSHQQALNYSTLAATAASVATNGGKQNITGQQQDQQQALSSTETLLRNIQSLLTVAADNARQQERQINYEKGEFYC